MTQPTPTPDGLLKRLEERVANSICPGTRQLCADAAARIRNLEAALQPFAAMARDNDDPNEVACERGIASDLTMITSKDFSAAKAALAAALCPVCGQASCYHCWECGQSVIDGHAEGCKSDPSVAAAAEGGVG